MASTLNPYISFGGGSARAALEFYQGVFGGELNVSTFGEYGDPSAPGADGVMHGMLRTTGGFTLMGADNPPGSELTVGNNISVSLSGVDGDELRGYWEKLNDGATVTVPLEKQMWGDEFGMLIDKFGVGWMVNVVAEQG